MKQFEFKIGKASANQIFKPIRLKVDIIRLWMQTIKIMSLNVPIAKEQVASSIILKISKMSRLFYVLGDGKKIFSVHFPFSTNKKDDDGIQFSTPGCDDVDNQMTSVILSLLKDKRVIEPSEILDFAESLSDIDAVDIVKRQVWDLFRHLMLSEDGYIRYDFDEERFNKDKHPLHHLDVFYSNGSTFKLGVERPLSHTELSDILDLTSNCYYITQSGQRSR